MSSFFSEDTCSFTDDPAIVGTIECTWSDVDPSPEGFHNCYIHRHLPPKVRKAWFADEKLTPGYVIVAFSEDYDGYCLVAETSLQLIDRAFAVGDIVKKRLSDTRSGIVMNTSMICALQPLCNQAKYSRQQHPPIQGHTPSYGPHSAKHAKRKPAATSPNLVHGFPESTSPELEVVSPSNAAVSHLLQAPASELKFWNYYREKDSLIYQGWVGKVRSVFDEVTIRLTNGSVVTVENPEELEEPYWIPGTPSYELARRLDRAGFYQYCSTKRARGVGKPRSTSAEPCYPGQHVQTKKGNLRCGRWKFGAYDPNITPSAIVRGIVVDVRNVQIEVNWLSPIIPQVDKPLQPPTILDSRDLESGKIIVYDRSKLPKHPVVSTLAHASYSPDTGFAHRVRFKDPLGAAVKYGPASAGAITRSTAMFDPLPRAATQGFDMNVFRVVATLTKVMVRWQDCSITEQDSTSLFPYLNPDENDVWPGEKVSSIANEEKLGDEVPIIRLHKVGVVQAVDAPERIARIRWFEGTEIDIEEEEKASQFSEPRYGKLRDEIVDIPLYDIAAHSALAMNRGDLVTITPEHADSGQDLGPSAPVDSDGVIDIPYARSGSRSLSRVAQPFNSFSQQLVAASTQRARIFLGLARDNLNSTLRDALVPGVEMVGEIVDLCLDGEIVVRLGAASEVREVKVPAERVNFIDSADTGSSEYSDTEDEDGDSYFSDAMSVSDEETDYVTDQGSERAVDVSIEYEGGEKLDNEDEDDEMWATDEEDSQGFDTQMSIDFEDQLDQHLDPMDAESDQLDGGVALEPLNVSSDSNIPGNYSSMPHRFSVLEDAPPSDHHFFGSSRPLTADLMRRVIKEHNIMQSSLPDGIFVRTWESRLDLLRVLIVGPFDTPYEFAPFVVDFHFGLNFPTSSPDAHFHSWTGGSGRINPNLYEDGKICLSLLGTWDADERNEEWSLQGSTVLQILVSLMGLVLVKEPYYSKYTFINSSVPPSSDDLSAFGSSTTG